MSSPISNQSDSSDFIIDPWLSERQYDFAGDRHVLAWLVPSTEQEVEKYQNDPNKIRKIGNIFYSIVIEEAGHKIQGLTAIERPTNIFGRNERINTNWGKKASILNKFFKEQNPLISKIANTAQERGVLRSNMENLNQRILQSFSNHEFGFGLFGHSKNARVIGGVKQSLSMSKDSNKKVAQVALGILKEQTAGYPAILEIMDDYEPSKKHSLIDEKEMNNCFEGIAFEEMNTENQLNYIDKLLNHYVEEYHKNPKQLNNIFNQIEEKMFFLMNNAKGIESLQKIIEGFEKDLFDDEKKKRWEVLSKMSEGAQRRYQEKQKLTVRDVIASLEFCRDQCYQSLFPVGKLFEDLHFTMVSFLEKKSLTNKDFSELKDALDSLIKDKKFPDAYREKVSFLIAQCERKLFLFKANVNFKGIQVLFKKFKEEMIGSNFKEFEGNLSIFIEKTENTEEIKEIIKMLNDLKNIEPIKQGERVSFKKQGKRCDFRMRYCK